MVMVMLAMVSGSLGVNCNDILCRFLFVGVAPGVYTLMASHPIWSVRKVLLGGGGGVVWKVLPGGCGMFSTD